MPFIVANLLKRLFQDKTNLTSNVEGPVLDPVRRKRAKKGVRKVVLVVQLVSRHSCVADRLPVVVRLPAGPLKTVDPPKSNGLGQKKA